MSTQPSAPQYEIRLRYECGCVDRWPVSFQPAREDEETICATTDGNPLACNPTHCGQCQATKTGRWCHIKYSQPDPDTLRALQELAEPRVSPKPRRKVQADD